MTACDTRYRTEKHWRGMRTLLGESQILWQYREVFQLLTTNDRYFKHLSLLFSHGRSLSDEFVLRQGHSLNRHCQSIDIDGIPCELLDERGGKCDSTYALIFVVPLSAYCQDEPASTTPLVSEMYAF